jgi:hypothetical protein
LLSLKLAQTIRGLPVEGTDTQLEIDTATGEIVSGSFLFVPDQGLPTKPRIAAQEAFRLATEALEATNKAAKGTVTQPHAPVLKYYRPYRSGDVPTLIWEVYAAYPSHGGIDGGSVIVVIDALTGQSIDIRPASVHAVSRRTGTRADFWSNHEKIGDHRCRRSNIYVAVAAEHRRCHDLRPQDIGVVERHALLPCGRSLRSPCLALGV